MKTHTINEDFVSGDQSGDVENGDSKNTFSACRHTKTKSRFLASANCHMILVGKMEDTLVAFLLVFIANLIAVYQLNIFVLLFIGLVLCVKNAYA